MLSFLQTTTTTMAKPPATDGMDEDENTDIFPGGINGRGMSPGYSGYTEYSPYLPIQSSPLRTSTSFFSTGRVGEEGDDDNNDMTHRSSPPRMPLSSPIRSMGYQYQSSTDAGFAAGLNRPPPRFDLYNRGGTGVSNGTAVAGSEPNQAPIFGFGPVRQVVRRPAPLQNRREAHLNPFQRGRGGPDRHRRHLFLKKMREGRDGERQLERDERSMALDYLSDKRRDEAERQRQAILHSIPDVDLLLDEIETDDGYPRPQLDTNGTAGSGAVFGTGSQPDEQELLHDLEMAEQRELDQLIELAEQEGSSADGTRSGRWHSHGGGGDDDDDDGDDADFDMILDDGDLLDFDVGMS